MIVAREMMLAEKATPREKNIRGMCFNWVSSLREV